jgi:hypothetical protein
LSFRVQDNPAAVSAVRALGRIPLGLTDGSIAVVTGEFVRSGLTLMALLALLWGCLLAGFVWLHMSRPAARRRP